jgi:hypothetical protein
MTRTQIDALFVINQDARFNRIQTIAQADGLSNILILSTHHLFKNERLKVSNFAPRVSIRTFADFLDDAEMQSCDDRATDALAPLLTDKNIKKKYANLFIGKTLKNKNELIFRKIHDVYSVNKIYFQHGLGVHPGFWHSVGAIPLDSTFGRHFKNKMHTLFRKIRKVLKKKEIHLVTHGNCCYFFVSGIKRLKFTEEAAIDEVSIHPIRWILFSLAGNKGKNLLKSHIKNSHPSHCRPLLATTIHEYIHQLGDLGLPLHVFVDGYHPPNYPRSYIDMYENCDFVSSDMFSEYWFHHHGKKIIKPLPFQVSRKMHFVLINKNYKIKTILLVLNHAGDWSALINRSDTDLLIESFSDIAQQFQEISFIVRPHPTMILPEHEGTGSLDRIRRYIAWRGLENLSVSEASLGENVSRGDVFISEYSQVLIDVFQTGKLGIIANLTGRRSFMEEYEKLGFMAADSLNSLTKKIGEILENPSAAAIQQNNATMDYNCMLEEEVYYKNSSNEGEPSQCV